MQPVATQTPVTQGENAHAATSWRNRGNSPSVMIRDLRLDYTVRHLTYSHRDRPATVAFRHFKQDGRQCVGGCLAEGSSDAAPEVGAFCRCRAQSSTCQREFLALIE